jgi:hypothetical protein
MSETAREARARGHEDDEESWRVLAAVAAGIAAVVIMVALIAMAIVGLTHNGQRAVRADPTPPVIATGPQLQSKAAPDLAQLRQEKSAMLNQYHWLDRDKGVAQIPIERAMQLSVAAHATPVTPAAHKPTGAKP